MLPLLLVSLLFSQVPEGPFSIRANLVKVVDGDTLTVELDSPSLKSARASSDRKLRLLGIDCPESSKVKKCGTWRKGLSCDDEVKQGKRVMAHVKELLPPKSSIRFEQHGTDRYGSTLAYVTLPDGRDLGLELVKEGLCKHWSDKYPHPRQSVYDAAGKR